ncbi:TPA: sodium:proton antiporter, partial [Klebsiella pneumoniae subsp. pneumoniae]|nr:sodium:proton antiporter [Klebsiella pneumoniae subsp. pneumoniae]
MRDTIKVLLLLGASFALVALEKTLGERALF